MKKQCGKATTKIFDRDFAASKEFTVISSINTTDSMFYQGTDLVVDTGW